MSRFAFAYSAKADVRVVGSVHAQGEAEALDLVTSAGELSHAWRLEEYDGHRPRPESRCSVSVWPDDGKETASARESETLPDLIVPATIGAILDSLPDRVDRERAREYVLEMLEAADEIGLGERVAFVEDLGAEFGEELRLTVRGRDADGIEHGHTLGLHTCPGVVKGGR